MVAEGETAAIGRTESAVDRSATRRDLYTAEQNRYVGYRKIL